VLAGLLDHPHTREILHVTYGAVLHGDPAAADAGLGDDLRAAVWTRREAYWAALEVHIGRHLRPFSGAGERPATKGATR
jgi:hypothetical protein